MQANLLIRYICGIILVSWTPCHRSFNSFVRDVELPMEFVDVFHCQHFVLDSSKHMNIRIHYMNFNCLQAQKAYQGALKVCNVEREDNAQYALYFYKLLTPWKFAIKKVLMIR